MSEPLGEKETKKQIIRDLIRELHSGVSPDDIKERFKEVLKDIDPIEIAQAEEQLIDEGLPREEIQRLCELHLAVFRESLERQQPEVPPGHPIHILLKEHELVKGFVTTMSALLPMVEGSIDLQGIQSELSKTEELLGHLKEYNKHKIREENCLFPYLEKHGVTQPPAIMWSEHDEQRARIKEAGNILENKGSLTFEELKRGLLPHLSGLTAIIPDHFYKEENILFPAALRLIGDEEWREIKASMDDLGYCYFTPKEAVGEAVGLTEEVKEGEGRIIFETGAVTVEELEALLNSLPVDITFVDKDDTVRYFSQSRERVFPRAKAVIGRKVQQCHPQKSIHIVNQILDDFRSGRQDVAEFWINLKGHLVYIRYFAVRSLGGEYLGCLEVTQDITDVKRIEGEKRLL